MGGGLLGLRKDYKVRMVYMQFPAARAPVKILLENLNFLKKLKNPPQKGTNANWKG